MWKEKDIQEFITKHYDTIDTAKDIFYTYVVAMYPLLELMSQSDQYAWLSYVKGLYFFLLAMFSMLDQKYLHTNDKIQIVNKLQKGAIPSSDLLKRLGFQDRWIDINIYAVNKLDESGLKDGQIYYDWNRVKYNIKKCPDGFTEEQKNKYYKDFQKGFPTKKY